MGYRLLTGRRSPAQIIATTPGLVMPAMPEKQRLNRFEPEFVESRREQLESILNLLIDHPLVARQPPLATFLKWPEDIQVSVCVCVCRIGPCRPRSQCARACRTGPCLHPVRSSARVCTRVKTTLLPG